MPPLNKLQRNKYGPGPKMAPKKPPATANNIIQEYTSSYLDESQLKKAIENMKHWSKVSKAFGSKGGLTYDDIMRIWTGRLEPDEPSPEEKKINKRLDEMASGKIYQDDKKPKTR